jgi:hypothetical protein
LVQPAQLLLTTEGGGLPVCCVLGAECYGAGALSAASVGMW